MLLRSVVVFAAVSATAVGQHRIGVSTAGVPTGLRPGGPHAMTNPWPMRGTFSPGKGWRSQRGWNPGSAIGPTAYGSLAPWYGNAGCIAPIFPPDLYPLFASGYCASEYYPPPPATNVIGMPPQPYIVPPAPYPINDVQAPDFGVNPHQAPAITNHNTSALNDHEAVANESAGLRLYQSPSPPPLILDEYPALVVLKTGGMFTVTKYREKAKTLYFVTSHGDTLSMPIALVEHVYPKEAQAEKK